MLKMLFKEELWQDPMNRSSKIKIYSYFIEMSQTRLPQQRNPLEDIQDLKGQPDLTIKPIPEDFDNEVLPEIEEKITAEDVFGLQENVKLDETVDKLDGIVEDKMTDNLPVPKRKIGKRGKDKVPRKRRQPTETQLLALEQGRKKSLETRRNKKVQKKLPPPQPATKLDYSTFSSYMDMYEESRKTKHTTSKEPHPNKVIQQIHRPMPPKSKPNPVRMLNWTGGQSKLRETRWNYGF